MCGLFGHWHTDQVVEHLASQQSDILLVNERVDQLHSAPPDTHIRILARARWGRRSEQECSAQAGMRGDRSQ